MEPEEQATGPGIFFFVPFAFVGDGMTETRRGKEEGKKRG